MVFAAHRDTFFRPLRLIRKGDALSVTTRQGVYRYRVEMIAEVAPDDVEVLGALHHPTLTLITCYPFVFVGNAPKRFVVRAAEIAASPVGTSPVVASAATGQDMPKAVSRVRAPQRRRKHHATLVHVARASHGDAPATSSASAPVIDGPEVAPQPAVVPNENALSPSVPLPKTPPSAAGPAVSVTPAPSTQKAEAQPADTPKREPSKARRLLRRVLGWLGPRSQRSDVE